MSLLSVGDAQKRVLGRGNAITATESVHLDQAQGRILAQDIVSRLTQPPFDASAMDGYALRADDAADIGSELTIIGAAAAGHAFDGKVGPGETVRIFTGAPVPEGADTILIQEDAEKLDGNRIRTTFAVTRGRHIRPRGQDFAEGETVLKSGIFMDYTHVTLAAATNHDVIDVYKKPLVAILATGDELVSPGGTPGPSQIVASNTHGIAALARECGADILDLGIARDNRVAIATCIDRARKAGADILVTVGGASVGDHDLVQSALLGSGMTLDFWRIAMRPGKPLMVGSLGDIQVLGLPGNPVSSMVCALLFLEPLILKMARKAEKRREAVAVTTSDIASNDKRQDYMRASLKRTEDGKLYATAFDKQDSSMMKIFARSDCLIIRAPHAPALSAGEETAILLLRPFTEA